MKLMTEEPFAPVMPLLDFSKLDDVIAAANDTPYGLAAYVFTNDLTVATRMAEGLEAGIIGINDPVPATPQCPFGGMKESGLGRELGIEGMRRVSGDEVRLDRVAGLNRIDPNGGLAMSTAELPAEAEPRTMTFEEFMALPDDGTDRELIRGVVKVCAVIENGMTIRNRFHARTEARIAKMLANWLDQQPEPRGEVVSGEAGFRLRGAEDSAVGIDVAYASRELVASAAPKQLLFDGPPVLAVEILSPSDTFGDVTEKVELYGEVGTVCWVVDPKARTVVVYRPGIGSEALDGDDELIGDPYLPGFRAGWRTSSAEWGVGRSQRSMSRKMPAAIARAAIA